MINNYDIKNLNRSRILRVIREKEIVQKKELVDILNLSITTVTTNTRILLEEGLIEEMGIAASTGGRKPVVFKFLKNSKVSLGVDISSDYVRVILTNLASEILEQRKILLDEQTDHTMNDILSKVQNISESILLKNGYDKFDCLGIGLSLPGSVNGEKKLLINAPNLSVNNYDFSAFELEIGLKVFVENEANVAAFAELILGSAVKIDHAVYVSITNGVGCGIIANHKVTKGTFNKAGEFGHMRISDQQILCNCGRVGCWEIFSSERALYKNYEMISGNAIEPDLKMFFKLYDEGNDFAKDALKKYLDYLLIGIENIMLGLDPEVIIIGGEIATYLKEIEPLVNAYMKEKHSTIFSRNNKLVFSTLAPQSSVIGSSLLPLKEMFGY